MTATDLTALLPLIVVAAAAVVLMVAIALRRNHLVAVALAIAGLLAALASLPVASSLAPRRVTPLVIVDGYALFFMGLILSAGVAVVLLSHGYLERQATQREEFYLLLLVATLGSMVLVASSHFASFFLGLEILSVSLYVLVGYTRWRVESVEAGLKYLVLAGASSAFLLFGMALIYADFGTMELARMAQARAADGATGIWLGGMALLIVGVGFKLAVVPFHLWTPDVYQGAPAPTTAFVATVSKGAVFALLLRFFARMDLYQHTSLLLTFALIAIASMLAGNLLALLQNNVKRILAYSSISHLGYLLVAFLAGGPLAATAVAFYLVAYFVTTLGAFGVVGALSGRDRDAEDLEDYRGLAWRRPWLAVPFTAMLLSLAGIPLTAGFVGKFYLALAAIGSALWVLVVVLVVASTLGLYYYLRVIIAMYSRPPEPLVPPAMAVPSSAAAGFALLVLTLLLLLFGVYPGPLIQVIEATVGRMG